MSGHVQAVFLTTWLLAQVPGLGMASRWDRLCGVVLSTAGGERSTTGLWMPAALAPQGFTPTDVCIPRLGEALG